MGYWFCPTKRCLQCRVEVPTWDTCCSRCHVILPTRGEANLFDYNLVYRGDIVPGQTQFINYTLTKTDKADVQAHLASENWLEQAIEKVLTADFRIVLSYDIKQEAFVAFVFPQGEAHAFSGYSISSRGSSASKALAVVLWKHIVLYDGSWPKGDKGQKYPVDL